MMVMNGEEYLTAEEARGLLGVKGGNDANADGGYSHKRAAR